MKLYSVILDNGEQYEDYSHDTFYVTAPNGATASLLAKEHAEKNRIILPHVFVHSVQRVHWPSKHRAGIIKGIPPQIYWEKETFNP